MKQQRKSFQCTNAPMHRCIDVPMCQLCTYQSHSDGDRVLFVLHVDVLLAAEAFHFIGQNEHIAALDVLQPCHFIFQLPMTTKHGDRRKGKVSNPQDEQCKNSSINKYNQLTSTTNHHHQDCFFRAAECWYGVDGHDAVALRWGIRWG